MILGCREEVTLFVKTGWFWVNQFHCLSLSLASIYAAIIHYNSQEEIIINQTHRKTILYWFCEIHYFQLKSG